LPAPRSEEEGKEKEGEEEDEEGGGSNCTIIKQITVPTYILLEIVTMSKYI
jgi:hypothetical protein